MEKIKKLINSTGGILLLNIALACLVYLILMSEYVLSILLMALFIITALIFDHYNIINIIFDSYNAHKAIALVSGLILLGYSADQSDES